MNDRATARRRVGRPRLRHGEFCKTENHVKGLRPVEDSMAHKKVERKKELDRRRHRREQRLKQRVREAKAAKA